MDLHIKLDESEKNIVVEPVIFHIFSVDTLFQSILCAPFWAPQPPAAHHQHYAIRLLLRDRIERSKYTACRSRQLDRPKASARPRQVSDSQQQLLQKGTDPYWWWRKIGGGVHSGSKRQGYRHSGSYSIRMKSRVRLPQTTRFLIR